MKKELIRKINVDLQVSIKIDSSGLPLDDESVSESTKYTEITRINIGRMKVKHLKLFPKELYEIKNRSKINKIINPTSLFPLIASLTGLTEDQVDAIDMVDLPVVIDKVMSLVGEAVDWAG